MEDLRSYVFWLKKNNPKTKQNPSLQRPKLVD